MIKHRIKLLLGPAIPYITVIPGLMVFHNAWAALVSYHLAMILSVFFLSEPVLPGILFKSKNIKIPVITVVAGASGGALLFLLWPLLGVPAEIALYLQEIGLGMNSWPFFLAYFILVNPLIEEYYWRKTLAGDSKQIVPNDLFFSGYHSFVLAGKVGAGWLVVMFLVLALAAWAWRQFNRASGGLLPSYASHLAADISIMTTIYCLTMR